MADAPAALPDPSWGVAKLLDYGAAKWRDGLAKLKAFQMAFSFVLLPSKVIFNSLDIPVRKNPGLSNLSWLWNLGRVKSVIQPVVRNPSQPSDFS
ncbi:MAG TPA: hypothetical protein VKJ47_09755 [Candidatus Binatia bacterium]|nr:hypothetical protein [Candidatus Binatia bacterium]